MSRGKGAENHKRTRVAAGPGAGGLARSLSESAGRFLWRLAPLGLIVGCLGGISALLWWPVHAQERSAQNERLTFSAIRAAVLQKPHPYWISKEDVEHAANLGLCVQDQSVFAPNLSRRLAQAYEQSPWVERTSAVRVRYPAQLEVELSWRAPVACVERSTLVLDRHGVVLNLMADSPYARNLPKISGVFCARTEAGQRVPEKELCDGLELLSVVRQALMYAPGKLQITTLQREASGSWRVFTNHGPMIEWGLFTDEPSMDEPRTAEKCTLLQRRLREIGDPAQLEYIRVWVAQAPVKPRAGTVAPPGTSAVH